MKKIIKVLFMMAITTMMFTVNGCSNELKSSHDKIKVYTSFYPMYDFAKSIGGDKIELINLVPPGTEPHDYEPTAKEIAEIENADIFIYSGANMEHFVDKVKESVKNKSVLFVEASNGISLIKDNPHVWLNPGNAKVQLKNIKDALQSKDSTNSKFYEDNYNNMSEKIDELNNDYKEAVSKFKTLDIVVFHSAYGYLCEQYGLNEVPIEGISPDSEPSAGKMAEVIDFVKSHNVKYIFSEELSSSKVVDTIAEETGAKTEILSPFEGFKDEENNDYISVMKRNLEVLKKALE